MPQRIFKSENQCDVYEYTYRISELRHTLIKLAIGYILWYAMRLTLFLVFGEEYRLSAIAPLIGTVSGFFWGAGIYAVITFRKSVRVGVIEYNSTYSPSLDTEGTDKA